MSDTRRQQSRVDWRNFWRKPVVFVFVGILVLFMVLLVVLDLVGADKRRVFTDGISIHLSAASGAVPRDVLWETPEPPGFVPPDFTNAIEPVFNRGEDMVIYSQGRPEVSSNLYMSWRVHGGEEWSPPVPLEAINTEFDELGPALDHERQQLYFYSNRPGGHGGYDIWVASWDGETWSDPRNLGSEVNSPYDEFDPAPGPDGGELYFSSNRKEAGAAEGEGRSVRWSTTLRRTQEVFAFDIYAALVLPVDGEEGLVPQFAQSTRIDVLNSEANDGQVAFSPRGDFLYFSSNRAGGFGGYDLYRSRIMNGEIGEPENVGAPVNSAADEMDPVLQLEGHRLLFTSSRASESPGEFELYQTTTREVVVEYHAGLLSRMWQMVREWGWMLLLALGMLLAMLWLLWMLRQNDPERRMGLVRRCLAASLLLHLLLLFLFTTWRLHSVFYEDNQQVMEVAIDTGALARERLALDIREQMAELPAAQTPLPELPRLESVPMPDIQPLEAVPDMRPPEVRFEVMPMEVVIEPEPTIRSGEIPEPINVAGMLPALELAMVPALLETPERLAEPSPPPPVLAPSVDLASSARQEQTVERPEQQEVGGSVSTAEVELPMAQPISVEQARVELMPLRDVVLPQESEAVMPSLQLAELPTRMDTPAALPNEEAEGQPFLAELLSGLAAVPAGQLQVDNPLVRSESNQAAIDSETELPAITPIDMVEALEVEIAGQVRDVLPVDVEVVEDQVFGELDIVVDIPFEVAMPSRPVMDPVEGELEFRPALEVLAERSSLATVERVATISEDKRPVLSADEILLADLTPGMLTPSETARAVEFEPDGRELLEALPELALAMDFVMEAPGASEQSYALRDRELRQLIIERLGGTEETEVAIEKALDWFTRNQEEDGHWSISRHGGQRGHEVGATGLALLCYYGWGATHKVEGPFQEPIANGLEWLLGQIGEDGDLRGSGDMYDHGIAAIVLAEAYGLTRDENIRPALIKVIDFIVRAQHGQGGWRYKPGDAGDTSVFGWQVMALRSARLSGIEVPESIMERADQFLLRVGGGDEGGLYGYQNAGQIRTPMVAEGMFSAQLLGGRASDPRMIESAEHIANHLPEKGGKIDYYYWYYGSLALYQHQGPVWEAWNERLREILLHAQSGGGEDLGSWDPEGEWSSRMGRVVTTALATLSLEVYYRYLPLLQVDEF